MEGTKMAPQDDQPQNPEEVASAHHQHRFLYLVGGSVVVACLLVVVSLQLYSWSGAAQLDLSLPAFNGVRDKIVTDTPMNFPSTGALDTNALNDFRKLYDQQVKQTQGGDGFNSSALDDTSLGVRQTQVQ